ncbi:STP22-like protein [Saccharomyces kudriavzevii IFO 1802]|uniref:STP22-like protein n=2 Tax=Saccharomyces kudriavzevii (strain ATCC MYA-4449 / AS 2.2408 / CBS 8840 / NBRC 1802 / NCYC 2889) TaxID=226230 RepID=J6E9W4_SACK1|nr:STP22-like protein [Saccharomyces kudriavzevii IFO 1802]
MMTKKREEVSSKMSPNGKISVPEGVVNWLFKVIQPIYEDGRRTFHDSLALLDRFHCLRPRTRVFTHPDGTPQLLLSLYGTIGSGGNASSPNCVPVIMWVPNLYPVKPPFISIDLENFDMNTISSSLPIQAYIDSNGWVALPILGRWDPATMNLTMIVQEFTSLLSEPSQDRVPSLPPKPNVQPSLERTTPPLPPKPNSPHVQPPLPPPPPPQPPSNTVDLMDIDNTDSSSTNHHEMLHNLQLVVNELYREDVDYVADKILTRQTIMQDSIARFHEMIAIDRNHLQAVEQAIAQTMRSLNAQIDVLTAERANVQQFSSASPLDGEDMSSIAVAQTEGLNQLYKLVAKDYALTDTIECLSRMLHRGTVPLDTFVKQGRELARQQFLVRWHIQRITSPLA